ncbi:uncharacterized protein LOC114535089 [Dendronephthya gigantea]|uniref:uncharacterized protein LOC114535089 n=1 Tax=Dendronephthya gigantea TaxID=151771 RepID=UPI00106CE715|nr:uncharacterized protein LOC114535089 [Dendronephthya gigantea]
MSTNLELELSRLKWDADSHVLDHLLDKYTLPRIVKVTGGFYGVSDDSTLCNGTILCLHSVQSGEKVHGRLNWGRGKDILIPLDCRTKVEVRRSDLKDVYERVAELCSHFPKYVRVSQGCYTEPSGEVLVEVGDKLQLKGIDKSKKRKERLICFDQHCQKIELPKDTVAGFQPLTDGKEYYLSDVVKKFKLPLNVQFVEVGSPRFGNDSRSANDSPCQPYQAISINSVSKETVVTATSIRANGRHNLIQFSRDMDVALSVCEETFATNEDFPNVFKIFNQGKEKTETNAYEYIDPATIMGIREIKVAKPAPDPPPKRPKPNLSVKPKTKKKTTLEATVEAEQNPIYQTIEEQNSECQKDSNYTELGPTYASDHKYGELIVQQPISSTKDQPEKAAKPKLPKGAIALPILWDKPQGNKKSKSDSDLSQKARSLPPKPDPQPQDEYSIPDECPTRTPLPPPPLPRRSSRKKDPPALPPRPISAPPAPTDTKPQRPDSPYESPDNPPDPKPSPQTGVVELVATPEQTLTAEQEREEIYQTIAKYPLDLSGLNVADVGKLLIYLGMEKYVETFEDEFIDGSMLASLDKESLQSLNVGPFHVKKLLRFIGGWRPRV